MAAVHVFAVFAVVFATSYANFNNTCSECVEHAQCVNGECQCVLPYVGVPNFYCVDPNIDRVCYGLADPLLEALTGENIVYSVIGSSLLTDVTVPRIRKSDSVQDGNCHFKLYGWTERYRGKFFFSGLGYDIVQKHLYGEDEDKGYIIGKALNNADYDYDIKLQGQVDSGESDDGCGIDFRHIGRNFIIGHAPCCGIKFALRVFHPAYPQRMPGYYFTINKQLPSSFLYADGLDDTAMCLGDGRTIEDVLTATGIADRRMAMTFHSFVNTNFTDYPGVPDRLYELKCLMQACPEDRRNNWAMFNKPLFHERVVKCLNGGTEDSHHVDVTVDALFLGSEAMCRLDRGACEGLKILLQSRLNCLTVAAALPDFNSLMNFDCNLIA